MADAGVALVKELKPGPVPGRPRVKPPGQPWLFGNVPAQID
jgi:hypothetical protein